jgi:hypothetical protein
MMKLQFRVEREWEEIHTFLATTEVTGLTVREDTETPGAKIVDIALRSHFVQPLIRQLLYFFPASISNLRTIPLKNVYRVRTGEQGQEAL